MVGNALASIAVGLEFGIPIKVIAKALASFSGVRRRLEFCGNKAGISVFNDYGHHPTEIKATLAALRSGWGKDIHKLHVIFQPHRYSRTRHSFVDFLNSFQLADSVIITDIYAAGEEPIEGISAAQLVGALNHQSKSYLPQPADAIDALVPQLKNGDFVLFLGAGSIGVAPSLLLDALERELAA